MKHLILIATILGLAACEADTPNQSVTTCSSNAECGGGKVCVENGTGAILTAALSDACDCDWTPSICEPGDRCSGDKCACDLDCAHQDPCVEDAHCDTWCPTGTDPDCAGNPDDGKYCDDARGTGGGGTGGGGIDAGSTGGGGTGGGAPTADTSSGEPDEGGAQPAAPKGTCIFPPGSSQSGGGVEVGDPCTADEYEGDLHVCNGTQELECKEGNDSAYEWVLDKDCADTDRKCSAGSCVAAASGGSCDNPGAKTKAYCDGDDDCGPVLTCMKPCPSCSKSCNLPCGSGDEGDALCASYGAGTCPSKSCTMCFPVCNKPPTRCEPL